MKKLFSWSLFKYMIKKNWTLWAGITAFILLELVACILMMDLIAGTMEKTGLFPNGVNGENALLFISSLFPMYACMFPMIFYIMVCHKLVSKTVDNTSMSTYLAAGITRKQYIFTAGMFLLFSLVAMFAVTFVVCGLCLLKWGAFDGLAWLNLNVCFLFVNIGVAFVCFLCSSVFAASRLGLALTIAVPVIFTVISMLAEYWEPLKFFTPFGWVQQDKVVLGTFTFWWLCDLIYLAAAAAMFVTSLVLFKRKQLSI